MHQLDDVYIFTLEDIVKYIKVRIDVDIENEKQNKSLYWFENVLRMRGEYFETTVIFKYFCWQSILTYQMMFTKIALTFRLGVLNNCTMEAFSLEFLSDSFLRIVWTWSA